MTEAATWELVKQVIATAPGCRCGVCAANLYLKMRTEARLKALEAKAREGEGTDGN